MNNMDFIFENKQMYTSLKYFEIKNDTLILNKNGTFIIPFKNVNLSSLNPYIFLLEPDQLFHTLYMLELLPKNEISKEEESFIINYTQRYLKLNDDALENNDFNSSFVPYIGTPISLSYDPIYEGFTSSKLIKQCIETHNNEIENGRGNQKRLVLIPNDNPNFIQDNEESNLHNFEKAGFSTLLLIASAVASTCLYIAYFILGK